MSTFIRVFVDTTCVHQREMLSVDDLLDVIRDCPPPKADGCSVYIAGPRLEGRMLKVAGAYADALSEGQPTWRNVAERQL